MPGSDFVIGWKIEPACRRELIAAFRPCWPDLVADHITLESGVGPMAVAGPAFRAEIVGEVCDPAGVQALIVAIAGTTRRPDGGHFHATWSLDREAGCKAVDSNAVIARLGWRVVPSISFRIVPARWRKDTY